MLQIVLKFVKFKTCGTKKPLQQIKHDIELVKTSPSVYLICAFLHAHAQLFSSKHWRRKLLLVRTKFLKKYFQIYEHILLWIFS